MLEFKGAVTNKFAQFAAERVEIRKREGSMRKDLFHYLVRHLLRLVLAPFHPLATSPDRRRRPRTPPAQDERTHERRSARHRRRFRHDLPRHDQRVLLLDEALRDAGAAAAGDRRCVPSGLVAFRSCQAGEHAVFECCFVSNHSRGSDSGLRGLYRNEAMRLQPPVPNGAQRSTQHIGARMIGDR